MFDSVHYDTYPTDMARYEDNPTLIVDFTLTGKIIDYTRSVLKIDELFGNFINYMYYIIMFMGLFSIIYNAFGARVYVSRRFFLKNPDLTDPMIAILKDKIGKYFSI